MLTHGEDKPRQELAPKIKAQFKHKSALPQMMQVVEL